MKQRANHANCEQCHAAIVNGLFDPSAHFHCIGLVLCVVGLLSHCDRNAVKAQSVENVGDRWQD